MIDTGCLLDVPLVTASEYASIEDRCRKVLGTDRTTFVFQGEAIVVLEAAAVVWAGPALPPLTSSTALTGVSLASGSRKPGPTSRTWKSPSTKPSPPNWWRRRWTVWGRWP